VKALLISILLCFAGITSPTFAAASKSEIVWSIQAALRELNLYNGLVNGAESLELSQAVVALERELKAPQTGALSLHTLGLVEQLRSQRQRRLEFERLLDPTLIESLTAEEFRFFLGGLSADQALRVFEQYPERLADLPGATYLRTERPPAPEQLARFIDAALLRLDYDGGDLDLDDFRRAQGLALGGAPTVGDLSALLEALWLETGKPLEPASGFVLRQTADTVQVRGSWQRLVGAREPGPLNSVTLDCYRDIAVCFAASAKAAPAFDTPSAPGTLGTTLERYDIQRWSEQEIAASRPSTNRCTITGLTINFTAKEVFRSTRNYDATACVDGATPRLGEPEIWQITDGRAAAQASWRRLQDRARWRKNE
jgi:hypothetical protein